MTSSRSHLVSACFAVLAVCLLVSPTTSHAFDIEIDIAPNVLNLQNQGSVVTVHTDVGYGLVDVYTVYLNGLAIQSWKADNQGNFVAKFSMDAVKELEGLSIGDDNTFQIVGLTIEGEPFVGEEDILIIDVVPRGR